MRVVKAAVAALMLSVSVPSLAMAEQAAGAPVAQPIQGTLLSISADGKTQAQPDMAVISLGVQTNGETAAAATAENARRMTALLQAVRRAGLGDRDVQTSNLNVGPQYQYQDNQPPRLIGYQATNEVSVRVRDVSKLGRVMDAAVGAGGNTVSGVNFTFRDVDAQLNAARIDAIWQAQHRADLYAHALNLHVARVISVSEGGGYSPPMPMPVMAMARAEAAPVTPTAPGEVQTTSSVTVVYELR